MLKNDLGSGAIGLQACLVQFLLNFISVGVGTGNFGFAESCVNFHSEVEGNHLCFTGVCFNH